MPLIAGPCHPKSASERELGEIVVVEAGDVLIVGAGESLLGLDHLNAVGHSGSEAIFRPIKILVGKRDVLPGYLNLLFRRIEIEKSGANVLVNLSTNVFRFRLPLPQSGFGLRDIAFNAPSGEEREPYPALKTEIPQS